jgi:hypothetical protein
MNTKELYNMTPAEVWHAWKNQRLTVGQVVAWQQRHNYYFSPTGGKANENA